MQSAKRRAAWSSASSHASATCAAPRPGRSIGRSSRAWRCRRGSAVRCSEEPLVQSLPWLAGCSGSPRTPTMRLAAPSPCVSTSTPQPTPQYGQVLRTTRTGASGIVSGGMGSSGGSGAGRRGGVVGLAELRRVDLDPAVHDAHSEAPDAAPVRLDRLAVREPDLPVVERTGDAVLEDEALREGSALVRTAVQQREDASAGGAEDRDVRAARAPQHAGARGLDVLERA